MDDYRKLQNLLLNDEREKIISLQKAIELLLEETRDPKQIINKLVPLINEIFSLTLQDNKTDFVKIFSPIIGELLEDKIKKSSAEIAVIMAPVIGQSIKEVVKNQRDEIVDALYPVMGNMISKYVAESFKEIMYEINQKVQSSFSFELLRRKINAKIKGVSETELFLQDSWNPYIILNVFLIHKKSGILISERSISGEGSVEPEMVASMLTAIRSFVNDWISKNSEDFELNDIEFGNETIRFEVAGCCYLATVLKGNINHEGKERILKVLEEIVEKYSDKIRLFEGNKEILPMDEINEKIDTLLYHEKKEEIVEKKISWIFIFILFLLFGSIIFGLYNVYKDNKSEEIVNKLIYNDPQLNLYSLNVKVEGKSILLNGRLPVQSLKERLNHSISKTLPELNILDKTVLTENLLTYEESLYIIKVIISTLNNEVGTNISFSFKKGIVHLHGFIINSYSHEGLLKNISSVNGVTRVISALKEHPVGKAIEIYYDKAKSDIDDDNKILLNNWIKENSIDLLLEIYKNMDLLVIGYSDKQGSLEDNTPLAKKRAQIVSDYLIDKGIPNNRIIPIGVPSTSLDLKENMRSVQIKWVIR